MDSSIAMEVRGELAVISAKRRAQIEGSHWQQTRSLQDAAYREFLGLEPDGTPAGFLEWLENSVEWMVRRAPTAAPEKLGVFSDRTAYRIFRRNRNGG